MQGNTSPGRNQIISRREVLLFLYKCRPRSPVSKLHLTSKTKPHSPSKYRLLLPGKRRPRFREHVQMPRDTGGGLLRGQRRGVLLIRSVSRNGLCLRSPKEGSGTQGRGHLRRELFQLSSSRTQGHKDVDT